MIRADALGYRHILSDISLGVPDGRLLALAGPNGAGKSTLLALVAGDLRPSTGGVWLHDQMAHRIPPRRLARLRAVMPQNTNVAFGFTAAQIVAMALPPDAPADGWKTALDTVDAAHLAHRRFPTLSGGEQARVTLARVLAQDTPIVLLDEPTAHLDIRHQHTILRHARALADDGRTVIAVLHDLNLATRYADQIALLDNGRLAALTTPSDVDADLLSSVYGHPIDITTHPRHGHPLCLPQ
ncbi:MAG TPA: heme ABC transporter ATP-binding protein [Micromonosporaceae bacterium]|nr:heme ABC transporter ATP-binding protein [Micromonosporaceae bacterium]